MASKAVIVFLKAPEDGRVKTRLTKVYDKGLVLELYKAFVKDTLKAASLSGTAEIFFYPFKKKQMIVEWLGEQYAYTCQYGSDLGERMANAIRVTFEKGYEQVILIGTDIPQLTVQILNQAFEQLNRHSLVLGPSRDGGYYLIGFHKGSYSSKVFKDIDWSTPRAFTQTLEQAVKFNLNTSLLPVLNDIDTPDDLKELVCSIEQGVHIGKHTATLVEDRIKTDLFKETKNA